MPRAGAVILSDYVAAGRSAVEIRCARCGRAGRYAVDRLLESHGNITLPDLRTMLISDCPQASAVSIYERCEAFFTDPPDPA